MFLKKSENLIFFFLVCLFLSTYPWNHCLAQGTVPFREYPLRITYLTSEIYRNSEVLVDLNKKLQGLLEECDCAQAQSQCARGGTGPGVHLGLSPFKSLVVPFKPLFEPLAAVYNPAVEMIKELSLLNPMVLTDVIGETKEELRANLQQVSPEKIANDLIQNLGNLKNEILPKLEGELKNLSPRIQGDFNQPINELKNSMNNLENNFRKLEKLPSEELKKNIGQFQKKFNELEEKIKRYPGAFLDQTINEIENLGKNLVDNLWQAFNLMAQCKAIEAHGDPCANNRKEIEYLQSNIKTNSQEISHLRELLKKEMETGLDWELSTFLNPEEAKEFKNNLERLLNESDEIIKLAENNNNLASECSAKKCTAVCQSPFAFQLAACLATGTGEQKPIILKFKAKVGLDDLDLGKVGIKNINLALPEKIKMPELGELSSFKIPGPEINITWPETEIAKLPSLQLQSIKYQVPNLPTLPQAPKLSLGSPLIPPLKSFDWGIGGTSVGKENIENTDASWYFQTLSWLSEKCQEFPGMKDNRGIPEEEFKKCFTPEEVIPTIIQKCQNLCLQIGEPAFPLPEICQKIRKSCQYDGLLAAADRCQELFNQEKEPIPSSCTYSVDPETGDYIFPLNFNPVTTLEKKCSDLKKANRKEAPEPCKLLPLFTNKFETPGVLNYSTQAYSSPPQSIFNYPQSLINWPLLPSLPKISFPKIILPKIPGPEFNLPPFVCVKLPGIFFEDLVLPDLNFCNLNECQNIWPSLNFQLPMIHIPEIRVPAITLPDLDVNGLKIPLPDISISPIKFPSIPFGGIGFPNLGNLLVPEIQLPSIPLPQPKISLSFEGIDLSAITSLISTFILNALGIPDTSLCIGFKLQLICCHITFPDLVFSWPALPKIPQIPFCEDVNQFCSQINETIKNEVVSKIKEVEKTFNNTINTKIQAKLDSAGQQISEKIQRVIQEELNRRSQEIVSELKTHIENNMQIVEGKLKIPPYRKKLPDIPIPGFSLTDIAGIPPEISIPWPEKLKKIQLSKDIGYQLPKIPLSKLSYEKEFEFKLPGFQARSLSFDINTPFSDTECLSLPPSGGNPCPKLKNLESQVKEIGNTFQKIKQMLE